MTAGPPHHLLIPDWDLSTPIVMYNDKKFDQPIIVQLCDEGDNATTEAGVRIQMAKDKGIQVSDFLYFSINF